MTAKLKTKYIFHSIINFQFPERLINFERSQFNKHEVCIRLIDRYFISISDEEAYQKNVKKCCLILALFLHMTYKTG